MQKRGGGERKGSSDTAYIEAGIAGAQILGLRFKGKCTNIWLARISMSVCAAGWCKPGLRTRPGQACLLSAIYLTHLKNTQSQHLPNPVIPQHGPEPIGNDGQRTGGLQFLQGVCPRTSPLAPFLPRPSPDHTSQGVEKCKKKINSPKPTDTPNPRICPPSHSTTWARASWEWWPKDCILWFWQGACSGTSPVEVEPRLHLGSIPCPRNGSGGWLFHTPLSDKLSEVQTNAV